VLALAQTGTTRRAPSRTAWRPTLERWMGVLLAESGLANNPRSIYSPINRAVQSSRFARRNLGTNIGTRRLYPL
jgi:hypothetical protein